MAIPKVMGIETEYGITVRNQADFNPILSSLLLINSYETYRTARIRWDYEAESPLRDARGFEYAEEKELPSKEESRLINLILPNGARFYVDHAHPEYSTPECTNPRDLVIWDRAGERIPTSHAGARRRRRRPSSASSSTRTTLIRRGTATAPTRTTSWTAGAPSRGSSST
jgi:proteasome accessory factor A